MNINKKINKLDPILSNTPTLFQIIAEIAGYTQRTPEGYSRQEIFKLLKKENLKKDFEFKLIHEKNNKYDSNALAVKLNKKGSTIIHHLGFIPSKYTSLFHDYLEIHLIKVELAAFTEMVNGNKENTGILIPSCAFFYKDAFKKQPKQSKEIQTKFRFKDQAFPPLDIFLKNE